MQSQNFRWGIVGLGHIAAQFANAVVATPGSILGAVCSRQLDKAKAFAAAAGIKVAAFDNYETMLSSGAIDAVYIASPNTMHREHALLAIAAGKPVLCEKPMATNAGEAREIAAAAKAAGVFFMEAMWTRFLPAIVEAKRLVSSGAIGNVHSFQGEMSFLQPFSETSRFYNASLGGGALLDLGVYPISLAIHLLGLPQSWKASGVLAKTGVEQRASIILGYEDATAALSCGFDMNGVNEASIAGEGGFIRLHSPMNQPSALTFMRSAPVLHGAGSTPLPGQAATGKMASLKAALRPFSPRRKQVILKPYIGNGFYHQISEVTRCLATGLTESPIMPLEHSILTLEIVDTASASIKAERH